MIQLKFYGLGGQGIVTAAKMLSEAVSLHEGKYAIIVPSYGHERRGAPVNTSIIIDDEPVLINSFVYEPDVVLVMDHTIIEKGIDICEGFTEDSILVLNTGDEKVIDIYKKFNFKEIYYVDATKTALEYIGRGIPNSSMLGAFAKTGIVKIESVEKAIEASFKGKAGEQNAKSARCTYERTQKI